MFRRFILGTVSACAFAAAAEPVTVFFENFEGQGASSAKQPERWDNPEWNMPRSVDGKWWVMGTSYYGAHDNPEIARQSVMGNIMIGRRRWCTTADFWTLPDPVTTPWTVSFKLLDVSYTKGALHVRFSDADGRGYGCMLVLDGERAREHGWSNRLLRWDGATEQVLAVAEGADACIQRAAKGRLHEVALRWNATGQMRLFVDGGLLLQAVDRACTIFTHVGVSVEYETRMTLDDIRVRAEVE